MKNNSLNLHICPRGYMVTLVFEGFTYYFNLLDIPTHKQQRHRYITDLFHWALEGYVDNPPITPPIKTAS